jgi:hypothetical protein
LCRYNKRLLPANPWVRLPPRSPIGAMQRYAHGRCKRPLTRLESGRTFHTLVRLDFGSGVLSRDSGFDSYRGCHWGLVQRPRRLVLTQEKVVRLHQPQPNSVGVTAARRSSKSTVRVQAPHGVPNTLCLGCQPDGEPAGIGWYCRGWHLGLWCNWEHPSLARKLAWVQIPRGPPRHRWCNRQHGSFVLCG